MTLGSAGFSVEAASIDGSAHLLVEIAALLYEGRLDRDLGTLCRSPHSHEEIGGWVDAFARSADAAHNDLVLLLIALSTKLKETGKEYLDADDSAKKALDMVLAAGPDHVTSGRSVRME